MKKYICIHGHFYQPPRENPWTGEVDTEESAKPFHDWNERISSECYQANTAAPLLNSKGETVERVNNFRHINFDIGPTLLSWMKRKEPVTYQAILDADRQSVTEHGGHGNAMAQIYNHLIMPLASRRDKITQVVWGIRDFEHHYKRKPEGMWLSEAAVDRETLEILSEQGILFTVLAPHQVTRVRRIGFGRQWSSPHHESIDAKNAYRILLRGGRHFHVFFYDAPISRAIAFQGLLNNGDVFVQKLMGAFGHIEAPQLVSTATDGESFGHHHRFGEMAVAYAVRKIQTQHLAEMTNYAEFLANFSSHWEVDIQQNSSWSCAHGVERWRADCGCRLNHEEGWNQKWRTVLREAFDFLKNEVDKTFESRLSPFVNDPWQARNDYISVLLDNSPEEKARFISRNCRKKPNADEQSRLWDLLEAQRFALFMYTSCGWFFDDISGLEPVQLMKFALRAMELAAPHSGKDLEGPFLKILGQAKSNIASQGTGADIFNRLARPARDLKLSLQSGR